MASRRGLHQSLRRDALSLAGCRSGWCRTGYPLQPRRDANAAKRFFKRLVKSLQYAPRVIVTDKLRSYGVAQRQLLPGVEHRHSRYLNNRAENSHRPTRRREQQMQTVQIGRTSSRLSLRSLIHLWPFSSTSAPTFRNRLSRDPLRGI